MADAKIYALPHNSSPATTVRIPFDDGTTTQYSTIQEILNVGVGILSAPLASPTFTGTVTIPTVVTTDNTTKAASTAFVRAYITGGTAVLGNGTTATTQAASDSSTKVATTLYVDTGDLQRLRLSGADPMTGILNMNTHKISNVTDPAAAQDADTLAARNVAISTCLRKLENYDPTATSQYPTTYAEATLKAGSVFIIITAGAITDSGAVTTAVEVGDLLIARIDAAGNLNASWTIVQNNIVQATTAVSGKSRYATDAESKAFAVTTAAVTPSNLGALVPLVDQRGLIALSTQAQVNTGTDFTTAVTPLTLQTKLNAAAVIQTATLTILSARVKTLNSDTATTTNIIVPSPGAGFAVQVVSAFAQIKTYGSAAYATNTTLNLICDTATSSGNQQANLTTLLTRTAACIKIFSISGAGAADNNAMLISNKALIAYIPTGDATAGDSDIIINVAYRIVPV